MVVVKNKFKLEDESTRIPLGSTIIRGPVQGMPRIGSKLTVLGASDKKDPTYDKALKSIKGRTGRLVHFKRESLIPETLLVVEINGIEYDLWREEVTEALDL